MSTTSLPRTLGKYRPIALIARGGMGNAYLAMAGGGGSFNKLVVLKVLKPELAEDTEFLSMFRDEARVAANLNHPNVVQTHEFGVEAGHFYIAMDFVDGQPLRGVRKRLHERRVPFLGAHLRVLRDVLEGLHYAHELADHDGTPLHLVHRDVSPHNVMVGYDGHARLLDFGIAKVTGASHQTSTGVLKGKVGYMAPEQARCEVLDRRADVFSLGVMMWEAVVGARMWGDLIDVQVLAKLVSRDIPEVPAVVGGVPVPEALRAMIHKATAADREHRYETARALALDLDAYLDTLPRTETGTRALSELVTQHFEVEREKRRRVVDEAIRQIRAASSTEEMPALLGLTASGGAPSVPGPALAILHAGTSHPSQPSFTPIDASHTLTPSHSMASSHPLAGAQRLSDPYSHPHSSPYSHPQSFPGGLGATTGGPVIGATEAPGGRQKTAWAIAAGAGVAVLLLVVGAAALSAGRAHSGPAPAPTPTPAPAAEVGLELVVTAGASTPSATVDGREVALGREFRVPRDSLDHTLVVKAPGHKDHTTAVRFDRDQRLSITLEALPVDAGAATAAHPLPARPVGPVGGRATAPTASAPAPEATATAPTGPKRPDRPIIEVLK